MTLAADWSAYQHDPQHTGLSNAQVDVPALALAWTAPTGYATPLVVGNAVYATRNGQATGASTTISSFALSTGAVNWSYTGVFSRPSQAAVGGQFVVLVGAPTSSSPSALYVLDAATGVLQYTVPVPQGLGSLMPTIIEDSSSTVTAYLADGSHLSAVSLGSSSGTVLWTQDGGFGGSSMPTLVGNSIVMVGPGQYYAFDKTTGAANHFWASSIGGGGGSTVAYDATRSQFYVREDYDTLTATLSAYHYADNNNITLLWQRTGAGVGSIGSAAIGPNGRVYSAGNSVIWELDPITGATLRSIPGSFANGMTPALSAGVLWAFSSNNQTFAFDLNTLQLLRTLSGSRGSSNSAYDSPGAICDNHFLIDFGPVLGHGGFTVHAAPGPVHLTSAVSRLDHGSAGAFDVNLPLDGSPGIECRGGGISGDFTLIFTFNNSLTSVGTVSVGLGTGSVVSSGIDPNDSHKYVVSLTGVADAQFIAVSLSSVQDVQGGSSNGVSTTMGVLLGDTNGDGFVDAGDAMQARTQSGVSLTNSNFREDVNVDGFVNAGDSFLVRRQSGTGLVDLAAQAFHIGR